MAFVEAFNSILNNKDEILENYKEIIRELTDTSKLDKESKKRQREAEVVAELLKKCVEKNSNTALNQAEYEKRYNGLVERYDKIKTGIEEIIQTLKQQEGLIIEFDEGLWNAVIDKVGVNSEHQIGFLFKDGMELNWKI